MMGLAFADEPAADTVAPGRVRPDYGGYSFANVTDTVLELLGGQAQRPLSADVLEGVRTDVEHVVPVGLDAVGWRQFRRARAEPHAVGLFDRLAERAGDAETLVAVTAGHGEIDARPDGRIALNTLELTAHLREHEGAPVPVMGGPRTLQLDLHDDANESVSTSASATVTTELETALAPLDPHVLSGDRARAMELFDDRTPTPTFRRGRPDRLAVPDTGFGLPGTMTVTWTTSGCTAAWRPNSDWSRSRWDEPTGSALPVGVSSERAPVCRTGL